MNDLETIILIKIWKPTYRNTFKYKREINERISGNRVKIKSIQLCKKLNLTYKNIKPILDKFKKKALITGYVWNEPTQAGGCAHRWILSTRIY